MTQILPKYGPNHQLWIDIMVQNISKNSQNITKYGTDLIKFGPNNTKYHQIYVTKLDQSCTKYVSDITNYGRISQIMVQISPKMDQISLNIIHIIKYDPNIAQISTFALVSKNIDKISPNLLQISLNITQLSSNIARISIIWTKYQQIWPIYH